MSIVLSYPSISAVHPSDIGEFFDTRRSSECTTVPRLLAQTAVAPASGSVFGSRAVARTAFTATQMRTSLGTAFAGLTDFRLCVWNATDRTLIRATANEATAANAAGGSGLITASLTSSLAVAAGDVLILGFVSVGQTAGTVRAASMASTMAGLSPQLTWVTASGYAGGTPPTIGSTATANVFWVELLP